MQTNEIVRNAFLDNLGTDWIAVAENGHIVGRATTREAVERSVPKAVAYYCQKDLDAGSKHAGEAALADPVGLNEASILAAFEEAAKAGPISLNPTRVVDEKERAAVKQAEAEQAARKAAEAEKAREIEKDTAAASKPAAGPTVFGLAPIGVEKAHAKQTLPPDSEPEAPVTGAGAFDHDKDGHVGGSRKRKPK